MARLPGWRIDKKTGKLVKIDKRNVIQKLQSGTKQKFVRVGGGKLCLDAMPRNVEPEGKK